MPKSRVKYVLLLGLVSLIFCEPLLLMENFKETSLVNTKWRIESFTRSVFGLVARCAFIELCLRGRQSTMLMRFTDNREGEDVDVDVTVEFSVRDDASHPARYFLENEASDFFPFGVVASDYRNHLIVWIEEDELESYLVLVTDDEQTRFPNQIPKQFPKQIPEQISKQIPKQFPKQFPKPFPKQITIKKLKLNQSDFIKVNNQNCTKKKSSESDMLSLLR